MNVNVEGKNDMKTEKQLMGEMGEDAACRELAEKGHRILQRNYRCRLGEIDIISLDGDTLVFTEVKTRSSCAFGTPAEAVNYRKRKKIINSANCFLKEQKLCGFLCRFDVMEVLRDGEKLSCRHITDAFSEGGI